jgi:KDO2-lipid IV(A) lauroyltransferase
MMAVLGWVIYYLLIKPLSLLPLHILYLFSDLLYYILHYLIGYRKKVVYMNLTRSFPDKNRKEIKTIAKKFYRHLCDLIVESVRLFSMPENELRARCKFVNPELLDSFYDQGRSIIIVAGHYDNWEMFAHCCNLQMKHQAVGIYTPLTNPYFERKFSASRSRFQVELLPKPKVKEYFAGHQDQVIAVIFGTDQSPSLASKRVYWTNFLNQDTAVMYGSEKYAREYNYPVIFARVIRVQRGYFKIAFEMLEENPAVSPYGSITERHTRLLERQIIDKPEYWLWTHKRWKRKRSDYPPG